MKNLIIQLVVGLVLASSFAIAQQDSNRYQPYQPTVVGGLPPGSTGLAQPVYVADRVLPQLNSSIDVTDGIAPAYLSASNLGFDESKIIPAANKMNRFESGERIAVIGEEPVLVGDLFPADKITPQISSNPLFEMKLRRLLMEVVTRKALAQRFIDDKVSGKPLKERGDAKKQMMKQTAKIFHQKWVPIQMQRMNCDSMLEFEEKLAEEGKTLQTMHVVFAENTWAQEHVREKVPETPNVELSELNDYYADHIDEFKRPARVRFQMLSADFSKFSSKEEAFKAIADMGNQILLGGAPFAAVAKRQSTGLGASDGGLFDWTIQGELKSKEIDKAIFANPIGGLSQIIENSDGFHIVEVLQREAAYTQTFLQAQADIRKSLVDKKASKLRNDFIKRVREETAIWSKWPEDIPGSRNISELQQ